MAGLLYLLRLVFLVKIVSTDSPVEEAPGDAVRNLVPPRGLGVAGRIERLLRDVVELGDRPERVIEERVSQSDAGRTTSAGPRTGDVRSL